MVGFNSFSLCYKWSDDGYCLWCLRCYSEHQMLIPIIELETAIRLTEQQPFFPSPPTSHIYTTWSLLIIFRQICLSGLCSLLAFLYGFIKMGRLVLSVTGWWNCWLSCWFSWCLFVFYDSLWYKSNIFDHVLTLLFCAMGQIMSRYTKS